MVSILKTSQPSIWMEGQAFSLFDIQKICNGESEKIWSNFHQEVFHFIADWFDPNPFITILTSGSTGKPRPMLIQKKFMKQSAEITCRYLGLQPKDKILLCMPMNYIAGKMMVVRACVAGLDIYPVEPSGSPLSATDLAFRFAAMVPLQIFNSLKNPVETKRLRNIGLLLIGGGSIDPALEAALKDFPNPIFASYGMAETVSHIALRSVNGANASLHYTPLPSVGLSLSSEGTLVVDAPLVCETKLYTNDLAEIYPDGRFHILGRKDNTIVSGGLKIQIETLEAKISAFLKVSFAITGVPDPKFGEIVVLAVENPIDESLLSLHLPAYEVPKKVLLIRSIPRTDSGKVNRAELKRIASARTERK